MFQNFRVRSVQDRNVPDSKTYLRFLVFRLHLNLIEIGLTGSCN